LLQKRIQPPAEVPQLVFLFGRQLEPADDFLDNVVDIQPPRREDPIHRPPEDAVGGDLFKHLLQGRLFGGLKRKL
jgi:hypothetical protein